ncbi:hypothetical protein [Clostridium omnivorum]|uniref:Flagellar hook-length control protein FliK n=1 Tax=Clostridium omnivorum TaxID=1604902 RepID=A0ABQ5N278_9CLOT|nr:hypothetical protein [Clostridium sp. E14]GLC29284.1 hypothetical protein bsdE14_06940 [Clostridium sp. E14]
MAGVNNVTGLYNNNNKKISSKLSFDIGEGFSARIVKTGLNNKDVIIKLLDGWQFPAELEEPVDFVPNGLLRFQVEGFKEGKLLIKLINTKDDNKDSEGSSIEDIIREQNLSSKDSGLLEKMVKFGIPLTKENVSKIKTLIGFSNKLNEDDDEEEAFIQKYMKSKNIEPGSEKAEEIRSTLKGFFCKLKGLSENEILTLLENNIDLNEENIDSFNKIFKEKSNIYKTLVQELGKEALQTEEFIQKFMNERNIEPGSEKAEEIRSTLKAFLPKSKGLSEDEIQIIGENNADITEENINSFSKVSNENSSIYRKPVNGIAKEALQTEEFIQRFIKERNIEPKSEKAEEIRITLKDFLSKLKVLPEDEVQTILENNVDLTQENIDGFNKIFKENSNVYKTFVNEIDKEALQAKEIIQKFMKSNNIESGSERAEEIRSTLRNFLSKSKGLSEDEIQTILADNTDLIEENIDSFSKAFKENMSIYNELVKKVGKEALQTEEFIQKFMKERNIEPGSEKAEEIRSTLKDFLSKLKSIPEDEIKTILKNDAEFTKENVDSLSKAFKENSNTSETLVKVMEKKVLQAEDNSTVQLFKQQIELKTEQMKTVIEKLLQTKDNVQPETFSKVLDNLNEHLNNFKVFNTMSNQYYYMDVPLNIRETNYDFKLIVKDDRKSGKKLDSKNIKLAASVETVNLGIVDAYFKVTNGKMDIEIKCEEPYVKLISSGKTILENELESIGYNVKIVVDKKDKEMNIVNCRDFFGENSLNGINVVV